MEMSMLTYVASYTVFFVRYSVAISTVYSTEVKMIDCCLCILFLGI